MPLFVFLLIQLPISLSQIPTDQLVGFWSFEGNGNDQSDNENHATLDGVELTTDRFGIENNAYLFDGIDDKITFPSDFDYPERSVCFWFQSFEFPDFDINNTLGTIKIIYSSDHPELNNGLTKAWVTKVDGVNSICFHNGDPDSVLASCYQINLGDWHFGAFTISETDICYYLDGQLVKQKSFPGNIHSVTPNGFYQSSLGVSRNLDSRNFHGKIDDIRIYEKKLNQNEIRAVYNESLVSTNTLKIKDIILKVFPNPTHTILNGHLTGDKNWSNYEIRIINSLGSLVYLKNLTNERFEINVKQLGLKGLNIIQILDVNKVIITTDNIMVITP